MIPIERLLATLGIGRGRRQFQEKVLRYFAGDLDRVERRAFEVEIMSSRYRKRVFAAEWDIRTRQHGLLALGSPDPDLSDCFSVLTLEAYVRGDLRAEDRKAVEHHLPCPLCGGQVHALREEIRQRAQLTWRERMDEAVGRAMGLIIRPGALVGAAAIVLAALFVNIQVNGGAQPAPTPSEYRGVSDGLASVELFAVASNGQKLVVRDDQELPADSRLMVRGTNDDIEHPRFFVVFSSSATGRVTWHIPSWDGQIPPSMVELPPAAEDQVWSEEVPSLPPGVHRVVILVSQAPANLQRLEDALTHDSSSPVDIETLIDMVGRRASISLSKVRIP